MPPADNARFVLTNAMVRAVIAFGWTFAATCAGFVLAGDAWQTAALKAIAVGGGGAGFARAGEGAYDAWRAKQGKVSPGDVGQRPPPNG